MKTSSYLRAIGTATLAAVGSLTVAPQARAAAFTAGDLVTYRVGDGTASLANTGNTVFLDEYTPTGTLVQSIQLANSGANALIASGTATSEGVLTLSGNGQYLALTGYNQAANATGSIVSGSAPRAVAIVDATGSVVSQTNLTDFATANNPRSAFASNDGQSFYLAGGAGGVRYGTVGVTTSTQLSTAPTTIRDVNVTGGQLYISSSSGTTRVATVGTGTPITAGQTITNVPGFPTTGSPYQFAFADLSPTVAGVDTLYVADDGSNLGIQKYSLDNGTWTLKGTISANGVRGLTLSVVGGTVNLYGATGASSATGGGSLFAYSDTSGYDAFTTGAAATTIATAAANEAFRGLAFVPTAGVVPEPTTVLGGVLLVVGAGWTQRRRLMGKVA